MRLFDIYGLLIHHRILAEKRNLNNAQNRAAKVIFGVMWSFLLLYLFFISVMLSISINSDKNVSSVDFLCSLSPFLLAIDFLLRFIFQQTPSKLIKPYVLWPIRKRKCIDSFIISSIFTIGNLVWFALLIPFSIMSVIFSYGIVTTLSILIFFYILIVANSQWYAIVRTLINDKIYYWAIPVFVYAILFSPYFFDLDGSIRNVFLVYGKIGNLFIDHKILPHIVSLAILSLLIFINKKVQYSHIMKELSNEENADTRKTFDFSCLDRFGEIGLYIKLEIKSIIRNKNPRKSFLYSTTIIALISVLMFFTDIYDSDAMSNFWCLYNFCIYGAMSLVKIMCNEGNYIDCLMSRRENILSLLNAKYLFYTVLLVIPFILMLPLVFKGKMSILMLVSYGVFTAGFQYFVLFQMAIYNKQTLELNTKLINKTGLGNNYFQILAELINFIIPVSLVYVLSFFLGEKKTLVIMLIIGIAFIATSKYWIRKIYAIMMSRRYANMESFRATR